MAEFKAGFKNWADYLGAQVVGVPIEDEWYIGSTIAVQTTTKGVMWYRVGAQPMFLRASRPGDATDLTAAIDRLIAAIQAWKSRQPLQ